MQRRFRPGRQAFIGAAAAALLGLGLGAWLKPPLVEAADPDPYENVVISLPAEASGSGPSLALTSRTLAHNHWPEWRFTTKFRLCTRCNHF